jgi:hypothetical protein
MISTVTTTTVSTLTALGVTAALGIVAVIALVALLISKEVVGSTGGPRQQVLARALNVGIVPLLLVFVTVVATRVVQILT